MRQFLSAVVVLALAVLALADDKTPGLVVDKEKRTITIDAKVARARSSTPLTRAKSIPSRSSPAGRSSASPARGARRRMRRW